MTMEPIKIVDKLTLRQEALRMAVELNKAKSKDSLFIRTDVELFARLIQGEADLPEYVDPHSEHKYFADLMAKLQDNFKPNPWISAESEIRPAKDMPIVAKVSDSDNYFIGKYNETGWIIPNAPNGSSVVAWCPIHPFTQPTKL